MRTVLRSLFSNNGFEVCGEAVNGVDAIEKADEFRPDLIVLDFCMPGMDGLEASRQITKLMPDVPLMMFTSHVSKVMEEDASHAYSSQRPNCEVLENRSHRTNHLRTNRG